VPGSSMFFNGMNDATARRDLVGWLMVEASR
jgi:cytochrome c2